MTTDPFELAERLALEAVQNPEKLEAYKSATEEARRLEGAPGWKGRRNKMTQVEKILDHIKKNGSITQREAYLDYAIQSFTRRIADLREMGYVIRSEPRKHPVTGQDYTRYFLDAEADVAA